MSSYDRTEAGFARAHADLVWLARFHEQTFCLYVPADDLQHYVVCRPALAARHADGTAMITMTPEEARRIAP